MVHAAYMPPGLLLRLACILANALMHVWPLLPQAPNSHQLRKLPHAPVPDFALLQRRILSHHATGLPEPLCSGRNSAACPKPCFRVSRSQQVFSEKRHYRGQISPAPCMHDTCLIVSLHSGCAGLRHRRRGLTIPRLASSRPNQYHATCQQTPSFSLPNGCCNLACSRA